MALVDHGKFVKLKRLAKKPEYNGLWGRVTSGNDDPHTALKITKDEIGEGRVPVFVFNLGKHVALKEDNLESVVDADADALLESLILTLASAHRIDYFGNGKLGRFWEEVAGGDPPEIQRQMGRVVVPVPTEMANAISANRFKKLSQTRQFGNCNVVGGFFAYLMRMARLARINDLGKDTAVFKTPGKASKLVKENEKTWEKKFKGKSNLVLDDVPHFKRHCSAPYFDFRKKQCFDSFPPAALGLPANADPRDHPMRIPEQIKMSFLMCKWLEFDAFNSFVDRFFSSPIDSFYINTLYLDCDVTGYTMGRSSGHVMSILKWRGIDGDVRFKVIQSFAGVFDLPQWLEREKRMDRASTFKPKDSSAPNNTFSMTKEEAKRWFDEVRTWVFADRTEKESALKGLRNTLGNDESPLAKALYDTNPMFDKRTGFTQGMSMTAAYFEDGGVPMAYWIRAVEQFLLGVERIKVNA